MVLYREGKFAVLLVWLVLVSSVALAPRAVQGQTEDNAQELKHKVLELTRQEKYLEAMPFLKKLAALDPNDSETQFYLGFALIAQSINSNDPAERKVLRIDARNTFIRAKELGDKHPVVDALIQSIPADGSEGKPFSKNQEANGLMNVAEALFSQGKLDDALEAYQKALGIDPTLYSAALFSADVYMHRGDFAQAEVWYQKAIAIDPKRETAYRYSATPFMKQRKYDQARDRYVEAFITEPYSRFAAAGLSQWAQVTKTQLGQPKIDIPTNVTFDEKGDAKINVDASALLGGKTDGSFAWIAYGGTRSLWHKEKFAKRFPNEKQYRHSLDEEADALHSVISLASSDKKVKLSTSLAKLKELDDKGLLEAYILIAKADDGIAADYPDYLRQNRDKLRRYVVEYFLTNGGK